jgi:hypothetical protein
MKSRSLVRDFFLSQTVKKLFVLKVVTLLVLSQFYYHFTGAAAFTKTRTSVLKLVFKKAVS